MTVEPKMVSSFLPILGHGFTVCAPSGCNIKEYLCSHLGIDSDYFDEKIQTLFLNGKVVDDPDTATVGTDSVLALSGAMPGLAGATLRRGGFYSQLRGEISLDSNTACKASEDSMIKVKLFNLVVRDLGPLFLKKGIQIDVGLVSERLTSLSHRFNDECHGAILDGAAIEPETLLKSALPTGEMLLQVFRIANSIT